MFEKILIANRGEIACRVAATANKMGIATVAVFSDADRNALHVEKCDEACYIGAAAASESYLRIDKIIDAALRCGAQAIHPGYGFLSENAAFAQSCEEAGIVFIGPPVAAIKAMGSKSEAKRIMQSAGVPLVPGYHGDNQTLDKLVAESNRIGFPQLIKASAGGGGKGMRVVNHAGEFEAALISAKRESQSSFGDDRVLIERYLLAPRHIEMQIFADSEGDVVHLYERDCSIQRRHQKILEEAPAPGMSDALRAQMGEAATSCAKAISYVGAGTIEFLLDVDDSFYFMEMNTRLQVEHPVTEMITGIDLVEWQLNIASGLPLPLRQSQIPLQGHAFEARIYAETPEHEFLPSTGIIQYLEAPRQNSQTRVETGVRHGDEIGINYDPMIAKLVVSGNSRESALHKMRGAISEYKILGVSTNIGFLARLLSLKSFAAAEIDTGFIIKYQQQLFGSNRSPVDDVILRGCLAVLIQPKSNQHSDSDSPWNQKNSWRLNLPARRQVILSLEGEEYAVDAVNSDSGWELSFNQKHYVARAHWLAENKILAEIDSFRFELPVCIQGGDIGLWFENREWRLLKPRSGQDNASSASVSNSLIAPMPGSVVAISVKVGETVQIGDILLVIEAMKMEHSVIAQTKGIVKEIFYEVGDQVTEGGRLLIVE